MEQIEISRQLKRVEILQDRFQKKRHQMRDELFDLSQNYHERHPEGEHEAEGEHSKAYEIESEIHHLRQEIEDLREAGKRDRAEQLELKAKELIEELEKHEPHKSKRKSGELESSRLFEQSERTP